MGEGSSRAFAEGQAQNGHARRKCRALVYGAHKGKVVIEGYERVEVLGHKTAPVPPHEGAITGVVLGKELPNLSSRAYLS